MRDLEELLNNAIRLSKNTEPQTAIAHPELKHAFQAMARYYKEYII